MFAAAGEGSDHVAAGLQQRIDKECLNQVRFVATDAPSRRLFCTLKEILPNLETLLLDPIHLAMRYVVSSSARKRTAGSATLRRCLAKFLSGSALLQNESFNWRMQSGSQCL